MAEHAVDSFVPETLLIFGAAMFGGTLGATVFQRFAIPQVVGYIVIGLAIGQSGFGFVTATAIQSFGPVNDVALAIIGFLVGGELDRRVFREHGKTFLSIMVGAGLFAFALAGIATAFVAYLATGSLVIALAAGAVLGAIASATDPAATSNVVWESRGRGILTTALIAVVAMDDALAMGLYALGTSIAEILAGENVSVLGEIGRILVEVPGACLVGGAAASLLVGLLRVALQPDKALAVSLGVILLVIGVAAAAEMDVILAAMSLGAVVVNLEPRRSREAFELVQSFATPIYVLFFVMIGASLDLSAMPGWLWGLAAVLTISRCAGKVWGAHHGAKRAGAPAILRQYTGYGLLAQGGVSVGLSIVAGQRLDGIALAGNLSLGDVITYAVAADVLVMQLLGPPLVGFVLRRSGEAGRDVTREDVIASLQVSDVLDRNVPVLREHAKLADVFEQFSKTGYLALPVVDGDEKVVGVVSLDGLRDTFVERDMWAWLVTRDVVQPVHQTVQADMPLQRAVEAIRNLGLDHLVVLEAGHSGRLAGMLDSRRIQKTISRQLLERQQGAA